MQKNENYHILLPVTAQVLVKIHFHNVVNIIQSPCVLTGNNIMVFINNKHNYKFLKKSVK